jgi:hypothetical protein
MTRINLDLGAAELGRRRREIMERFVYECAPPGRRGDPSMSEAVARMFDAFEYDPARITALFGDIMEVAGEAYALEAEAMAQQAAETIPPPAPTAGKYRGERAAKLAADLTANPFVVQYTDGSFDWFPHGAAVAQEHQIVARRVAGRGWKYVSK